MKMKTGKREVPAWMRTTAKIGIGMFGFFGITALLAHNWVLLAGMTALTFSQVAMLLSTKAKS